MTYPSNDVRMSRLGFAVLNSPFLASVFIIRFNSFSVLFLSPWFKLSILKFRGLTAMAIL